MTQPTNIIRLGDRFAAPARAEDNPVQVHQNAAPVVGPADRIAGPDGGADLTNVIAFTSWRRDGPVGELVQDLILGDDDRPTIVAGANGPRRWIAALLVCSGVVHAGILAALNREPPPMASIGVEAISVELVLGADNATGPATSATEVRAPPERQPPDPATVTQEAAGPSHEEKPEPAPGTTAADPDAAPQPREANPEPVMQEAALPAPPEPTPAHPVAIAPPPPQDTARNPERAPERKKPVEQAPPPRSTKPAARPAATTTTRPPRTDGRLAAREPATAPGGVGPGRSDAVSNYQGIAAAHLKSYQHLPAGVLRPGERRTGGTVSFTIDGSGRVTRVALVRAFGVASLDAESEAMVRRASPFPPPPGGRPMTITAPVAFSCCRLR
jgi:periplasmic protein TonB